jgi:hypothetical protein
MFFGLKEAQVKIRAIHLESIMLMGVPLSFFWLYSFFWAIPRRLNFMCKRFGTLCLFHLHRHMKTEKTECSEMSACIIQTPGNHQKEIIQYSQHGESLKSRIFILVTLPKGDPAHIRKKICVSERRSCNCPEHSAVCMCCSQ